MKIPSRVLNESSIGFGLEIDDVMGLAMEFLLLSQLLGERTLISFLIILATAVAFVPLRLNYRRKVIRDFVAFHLRGKVIYE